ncbi:hypothetical protein Tco_0040761, partial [Tanacetum coccineum]
MDWLSKRKFVIVCHEKVVRIPLEGDEILRVHGECTQGVMKTLVNTKSCKTRVSYDLVIFHEEHQCRLLRSEAWSSFEVIVGITEEGEVVTYLRFIANFSKIVKPPYFPNREESESNVKDKILATPSETSKVENAPAEMLRDPDQQMEKRADDDNRKEWNSGDDQLRLRWMIYLVVLADIAESVRDTIGFESPVLWAEIGESSLTGPELVLDMTDKVALIKEKLKAARDRQKSYADKIRKLLEFEVGDRVLLKVSPWKGVLRLPEELSSVHDTFDVSNLKKCLADANLHVPLNEIKINKTLHFVEELIEIMDREIRNLKHSKIPLMKVHWNSKYNTLCFQVIDDVDNLL